MNYEPIGAEGRATLCRPRWSTPLMQVKKALGSRPLLFLAARKSFYLALRIHGLFVKTFLNRVYLERYARAFPVKRLHLGCEHVRLKGWLNTDKYPQHTGIAYCAADEKFPFASNSLDRVFSEHMIEHLLLGEGLSMLRECYRVLRSGGRIRIATPDLDKLVALLHPTTALQKAFITGRLSSIPDAQIGSPAVVFNQAVRAWGHQFIYDAPTLAEALSLAGFREVKVYAPGMTEDVYFEGVDHHGVSTNDVLLNEVETMVIEATKP